MIRRLILAALILATGVACDRGASKPEPPRNCPPGQTVQDCLVSVTCVQCGETFSVKKRYSICATDPASADERIFKSISGALPDMTAYKADCVDTGQTSAPEDENVPALLLPAPPDSPESWGGPKCSPCMAAHCKAESIDCAGDATCHGLDGCLMSSPLAACISSWGELESSTPAVNFFACANRECAAECSGASSGEPICPATCPP